MCGVEGYCDGVWDLVRRGKEAVDAALAESEPPKYAVKEISFRLYMFEIKRYPEWYHKKLTHVVDKIFERFFYELKLVEVAPNQFEAETYSPRRYKIRGDDELLTMDGKVVFKIEEGDIGPSVTFLSKNVHYGAYTVKAFVTASIDELGIQLEREMTRFFKADDVRSGDSWWNPPPYYPYAVSKKTASVNAGLSAKTEEVSVDKIAGQLKGHVIQSIFEKLFEGINVFKKANNQFEVDFKAPFSLEHNRKYYSIGGEYINRKFDVSKTMVFRIEPNSDDETSCVVITTGVLYDAAIVMCLYIVHGHLAVQTEKGTHFESTLDSFEKIEHINKLNKRVKYR